MAVATSEAKQELSVVCQSEIVYSHPGDDVVLSCHLDPAINAVSMEIKWWIRGDVVCHYKDGQVRVNRDNEGRVSISVEDLQNGNVSLILKDIRRSQKGRYLCEVIFECQTIQDVVFLHISTEDFSLVTPTGIVSVDPGGDVTLPVHLSPETSAVSMITRWFRGKELILQFKNRQEKTYNDSENRMSLSIQELERGNLSLTLRNVQPSDLGDYTCKVFHDGCLQTGIVHLQLRDIQKDDGARLRHLQSVLRQVQKNITLQRVHLLTETSQLIQKTLSQEDPKSRRSSSMEAIHPNLADTEKALGHMLVGNLNVLQITGRVRARARRDSDSFSSEEGAMPMLQESKQESITKEQEESLSVQPMESQHKHLKVKWYQRKPHKAPRKFSV